MNNNNNQEQQQESANPNSTPDIDVEKRKEEQQKRNDWLKEKMELRQKQKIQFIITQTNYDEKEAIEKLEACNNDVMKVVNEYLGIGVKKDENVKKTKNQKVFSVIRDIMDSGSKNFIMQQERAKKIEEIKKVMEMKKQNGHIETLKDENNVKIDNVKIDNVKTMKEKID